MLRPHDKEALRKKLIMIRPMTIVKESGVTFNTLYRFLKDEGNSTWRTLERLAIFLEEWEKKQQLKSN